MNFYHSGTENILTFTRNTAGDTIIRNLDIIQITYGLFRSDFSCNYDFWCKYYLINNNMTY